MSAEIQMTFRTAGQPTRERFMSQTFADTALKASARFWFLVTVIGQLLFAFTVASFYASTAARGDLEMWNRFMPRGHVPGDTGGNLAVAVHLLSAVLILLAGALQFVPRIRARFPAFHRWSGRTYILTAFTLSIAGLYMHWIRGSIGDLSLRLGSTLNAVLIWLCAGMALHYAVVRNLRTHRRWALRLFLVVSASWFFRIVFFLSFLLFQRPVGFDPNTFQGPFLTIMAFAQSLFPLAVLELYFRAQDRPGVLRRLAMASGLVLLTAATGAGTFAITGAVWMPAISAAYDSRKSIARTLSATIASSGVEQAFRQYRDLRATGRKTYSFDEVELNALGYELLRAGRLKDAIRVFQLNVQAYPRSSNTYDSLAEAYLRDGNKPLAIANYQRSAQLDPKNRNALFALQKLGARVTR
jgi:uncharacterized membrane protein